MKPILIVLIMFSCTLIGSVVSAETLMSEQAWEECRNDVAASTPTDIQGASGGGLIISILERCGPRPVVETKSGYALLKSDCDGVYQNALDACRDIERFECSLGVSKLPEYAKGWFTMLSPRAFDKNRFHRLCVQVCKTKRMPNRRFFGQQVCGGV